MSFQPGAALYSQGFGTVPAGVAYPYISARSPTTSDIGFAIGQRWVNTVAGSEYFLGSYSTSLGIISANWGFNGSTSGDLNSLTTDDAAVVTPTAGTIIFHGVSPLATTGSNSPGTTNIALTGIVDVAHGGTGDATLTLHGVLLGNGTAAVAALAEAATGTVLAGVTGANPAFTASPSVTGSVTAGTGITATTGNIVASAGNISATLGSVTAGTTVTATLGNITATNGNIVRGTAGNKDVYTSVATTIAAGANSAGTVTLVAGEAIVSTSAVTAASQIRIYRQSVGATGAAATGNLSILTRSAGVSFTIRAVQPADATAAQASDVSVIGWEIVN